MSASIRLTLFWRAGLAALLLGAAGGRPVARGDEAAPGPEPFYFDFWNLSGQKSPLSDPWKIASDPAVSQSAQPAVTPELPRAPKAFFTDLMKRLAQADDVPGHGTNAWSVSGLRRDPGRLVAKQETSIDILQAQSTLDLPDLDELRWSPAMARTWKSQQELKIPMPVTESDSLFVFSTFDGNGTIQAHQVPTMTGKTGLGLKFSPLPKSEVQVRGGPQLTYSDPSTPGGYLMKSQVSLEFLAKVPLVGPLQLQYKSAAIPALAQTEKDQINQDLKIALPLGNSSQFYLGAKYRWEYSSTPTSSWVDRASIYMGLELKH